MVREGSARMRKWWLSICLALSVMDVYSAQLSEKDIDRLREQKIAAFKEKQKEECEYWKEQESKGISNIPSEMVKEHCPGERYKRQARRVSKEVQVRCQDAIGVWQKDKSTENAYAAGEACFPGQMPTDLTFGGDDGAVYKYEFPAE